MAVVNGIVVTRSGDWFEWKLGASKWEFRQWPLESLRMDGLSLTEEARKAGVKLVAEAVVFSLGYYAGVRQGWADTIDRAMKA